MELTDPEILLFHGGASGKLGTVLTPSMLLSDGYEGDATLYLDAIPFGIYVISFVLHACKHFFP